MDGSKYRFQSMACIGIAKLSSALLEIDQNMCFYMDFKVIAFKVTYFMIYFILEIVPEGGFCHICDKTK